MHKYVDLILFIAYRGASMQKIICDGLAVMYGAYSGAYMPRPPRLPRPKFDEATEL